MFSERAELWWVLIAAIVTLLEVFLWESKRFWYKKSTVLDNIVMV